MEPSESQCAATVLVVDDNDANRLLAQSTLEDEGYRVVVANGGAEGVAAFEREKPDCVLLDIRMPEVDGFAACEQIRSLPGGTETPVLFLTALRDVDTFDRALRAGGDDFVTKPVRPTELVVRVQTALKLRRVRVELQEHYDLLKRQRDDLMRLQLQKERLTAFVVHDLKNPVNTLDLHAQLLQRDRDLSDDVRASVNQIRAEARQLGRMIQNLLDLSKADEGKLSPKRSIVDVRALVAEIFDELMLSATQRKVTLEAKIEAATLDADADLFRRTLANLVENAIRHAPPQTIVTVRAHRASGSFELRVEDKGAGVPPEMREKIFDAFVQMEKEGQPRTGGGRGLGLTFCRLAVLAHGGVLRVLDGAPGAIFCAVIPDENEHG